MNTVNKQDYSLPPHPGIILKGEIDEHGLSQRELAAALGKSAPMINGILNGNKDITVEIAILLEAALPGSMKAQDWLTLQNIHDISQKRVQEEVMARTKSIAVWNFLRSHANMSALKRKLEFGIDFEENMNKVMSALGISTVEELAVKLKCANTNFKKSDKIQTDPSNLNSWMIIVRHMSNVESLASSFNPASLPLLIDDLNVVFRHNTDVVSKTRSLLNKYGIKFLTDEKRLDKVPVDGYSFWSGNNPTIVATMRMNRLDNFAFTIMHELGHICLHLEKDSEDEYIDVDHRIMQDSQKEKEANNYATNAIWSHEYPEDEFASIFNPYASARQLQQIARERRVHPAIVTGQYQFYCTRKGNVKNPYTICREMIAKIG